MTDSPLKRLATVRVSNVDKKTVDGQIPVRLCNYTDVYYRAEIASDQEFMRATASSEQLSAFRLRAGDVVITKDSETAADIGVAAYVRASAPDLVCGYHLAVLRPEPQKLDGRFLYWFMSSAVGREQLAIAATGVTRFGLRADSMGGVLVPPWELRRQRAIADYLDTETARVDALIAKKESLHELLSVRERSLIEQQLLGAAGGTVPLRRLVRTMPQYGATESGEEGDPSWPRYIRITDLRSDGSLRDDGIKRLDPRAASQFYLSDNDVLFARSGATSGKAFRYRAGMGPASFAGYLIRFQFDESVVLPEFIELWTQTAHYWGQIAESTVQATIQNVSADKYMSLEVPQVAADAQVDLVEKLRRERMRTARLRRLLEQQVSLLSEHRRALITAAVTGELEMPGVA